MDPLIVTLRRVRRRMAVMRWLHFCTLGFIAAGYSACGWVFLTRMFLVLGDPLPVCAGLLGLALAGATVWAVVRRPSLTEAALAADARLGLKERLTSSLQLAGVEGEMVRALHADARRHLERLDVPREFRVVPSRAVRWASVPVILFGLCYVLLPEFDLFHQKERQAEALAKEKRVDEQIARLEEAIKPLKREALPDEAGELAALIGEVERVAEQLESGELNEKEALAKVLELGKTLDAKSRELERANPLPKLSGDARKLDETKDMAKALQQGDYAEAQKKMQEMKDKLDSGKMTPEEQQKLASELGELSKMLGGDQTQLGEKLAELAEQLKNAGGAQMAQGQFQQVEMTLEQLKDALKQMEQMQLAKACLGKCAGGLCEGQGLGKFAGIGGAWNAGEGNRLGGGMGNNRGRGRGGQVGELPETPTGFAPSFLPGEMTPGKLLASIEEHAAPDEQGAESQVEYLDSSFTQVQQEAEQALAQEEIPPASKELVRQYFGLMEDASAPAASESAQP